MSNSTDFEKGASQSSSADENYNYGDAAVLVSREAVAVQQAGPKSLQKLVNFMGRLGGEERGIERVLPHEKTDQKPFDNFSVWYIFIRIR
jgi:hypothetical protein